MKKSYSPCFKNKQNDRCYFKRHFVPRSTLVNIYKSLILPHLSYGIVVWGQAAKIHLEKFLKLQKRVLRLIYFEDHASNAIPLFVASKILPYNINKTSQNFQPRKISKLENRITVFEFCLYCCRFLFACN